MNKKYSFLKRFSIVSFVFVLLIFSASSTFAQADKTATKEKSLYERLGGYDALAAVTDDFLLRLGTNKLVGRFLVDFSEDSKGKIRQHFIEFLCSATGGSCVYMGRDMKTTHKGIGITEEDWKESVKLLVETLDKFKVPEKEKSEVLAAVSSLKGDIVEKK
ncbi:MAG: group 1 truncated hemoglobin [Pyrinomonadaceae bacterium]